MNAVEMLGEIEVFSDARIIGELGGGPASDSYLVERGTERFMLRLDTTIAAALGLDRYAEAEILKTISLQGLGPAPEFFDPDRGILITRFIKGRAWNEADLHDPDRMQKLAVLLRRLHALEPIGPAFNLHERIENYARIVGTANSRDLADDAQHRLRELSTSAARQCLCHNDLICANIIEGQGLSLIDWEYAAIGDPFFDLATIVEHHRLDRDDVNCLLQAYFGAVHEDNSGRLERYRSLYNSLQLLWLASVEKLQGLAAG